MSENVPNAQVIPMAMGNILVYRPNGRTDHWQNPAIDFEINSGCLIVSAGGVRMIAYSPGQWLTVTAPSV